MNLGTNERLPMAHPQPPAPDTVDERPPMVSKKPGLSRRIQIGLAKLGLITTVAAGGAGVTHHVTGVELGGPIPVGAAADGLVKLANNEPQQEQQNLNQEREITNGLFRPNYARVGGQIEIELANLSEARTKDILLAIRLGNPYEKIDPNKLKAVDNLSAEPGAKFIVDSPTVVDLTGQGLGTYYTGSIETNQGLSEPVLIPESSVKLTVPGKLEPLSRITESDKLDVARKLSPTQ